MHKRFPSHSTIFSILFLAVFFVNSFISHSTALGLILLVFYVFFFGAMLAGVLARKETIADGISVGILALLSAIMIIIAIFYYFFTITPTLIQAIVLFTVPVCMFLRKKSKHTFSLKHEIFSGKKRKLSRRTLFAATLIILCVIAILTLYQNSPITDAVRSPWERLDSYVFILMGIALILTNALLFRGTRRMLAIPMLMLSMFAFLSLVVFVFPLGFGFDSFIHQATELHLSRFGTISPKPFYYIGQYALVLFTHHGFFIPVNIADTFLLPILAAILLPLSWYSSAVHIVKKKTLALATLVALPLIPLSSFIVTTPQGLANLWMLLLILSAIPLILKDESPGTATLSLIALGALVIHPIAGIPALLFVIFLLFDKRRATSFTRPFARVFFWFTTVLSSVILPVSFIVNSITTGQTLEINWRALTPLLWLGSIAPQFLFENRFNPILDFVYAYGLNSAWLIVIVSALAWILYRKDLQNRFKPLLIFFAVLGVNYILLKTVVNFSFLIDYERQNYADRIVPLMLFALVPFFILGIGHVLENVKTRPVVIRALTLVLITAFATSAFYLSYPRKDIYETHHGFNVSQSDIDAVYMIEEMGKDEPYIVLANQSVSAAAIKHIGFRYYSNLFFYPIPTGQELYQIFLKMNSEPTIETAKSALALVPMHGDVNELFFVVNNYWWQSSRIIETAKTTANEWRVLNNGAVHIFRYTFE